MVNMNQDSESNTCTLKEGSKACRHLPTGGLTDLSSLASMKRCHECESVSGPDAKYATGSLRYCAKRSGA